MAYYFYKYSFDFSIAPSTSDDLLLVELSYYYLRSISPLNEEI